MNEKTKDSDNGVEAQRFSPTDWDWVMLLSGEINAIETSSDTLANMFIGACGIAIVILIAALGIAYSNITNPSIIVLFIVLIFSAIIILFGYPLHRDHNKRRRIDEDRVKLLEECRDEIFDRLDDPDKIVERCFKKDDENR